MNKMVLAMAALALMPAAPAAIAAADSSAVDAYYSHLTVSVDGIDDDLRGDGGGLRLWFGERSPFFSAEFQHAETDGNVLGADVDARLQNWRTGLGWRFVHAPMGALWLRGEYVAFDAKIEAPSLSISEDDTQEGYGAHFGGQIAVGPLRFFGEFGYVDISDADGTEWRAGLAYQPRVLGVFAEFRRTDLETDDLDLDQTYDDARVGVRVAF